MNNEQRGTLKSERGRVAGPSEAPDAEEAYKLCNERLARELELSKVQLDAEMAARRQAEETGRAAAQSWQTTFNAMLDPVVLLQPDGAIQQCNQAFAEFVGEDAGTVIGKKCFELVHRANRHIQGCPLLRSIRSSGRETMPMSVGPEEFLVVTDPVKGPDNEITGLVHVMHNITELKRVQEALLREKEFADAAINSLPGVFYLFDEEGRCLRWNTNLRDFSGYSDEEISGMRIGDFFVEEEMEGVGQAVQQVFETGEASVEARVVLKDGRKRPYILTGKRFTLNDRQYLAGMGINISPRKEMERLLQESEQRFRNLYDDAPVGYFEYDLLGNIVQVNRTELTMLGYTAEEMIGQPCWRFIVEEDACERILAKLSGIRPPDRAFEQTYCRKDGATFPVLVEDRLLTDADGHITGIRTTIQDISDRRRAEAERERLQAELIQSQKMESIGRLAGGVAHDFNNKLSIIVGYAQLAMKGLGRENPLYEDLQEILQAGTQSVAIVRQLLAYARKQTIMPRPMDLNETVEGLLKMLRRLIGEDIDLSWRPAENLWPVNMDPTQIDMIMANLCINARDAIAGVGELAIATENVILDGAYCERHAGCVPGEYAMLAVSDDGVGMDKETLDHIFEPFFTTKEAGKGTGLGLSTVYGIVKQNQGYIDVASTQGRGASFRIYLPRCVGEVEEDKTAAQTETPRGLEETILLVEDDVSVLRLIRVILSQGGYRVLATDSPLEAIEMVRREEGPIHLLLTDVVMPQLSGRELANEIENICPTIKVLFMSGYASIARLDQETREARLHFIEKPFSPASLAQKVREAIDIEN